MIIKSGHHDAIFTMFLSVGALTARSLNDAMTAVDLFISMAYCKTAVRRTWDTAVFTKPSICGNDDVQTMDCSIMVK